MHRSRVLGDLLLLVTGRRPITRGWWILAGAFVGTAVAGGIYFWSFGLLIAPLERDFGWSRAEISLGFSLGLLTQGLAAPLIGRWIDVHGPRSAMLVGTGIVTVLTLLLATTAALWQWYLFLGLSGAFRGLVFGVPIQALVARWFETRRGLAIAILGTGMAAGALVMVPVMRAIIDVVDWDGGLAAGALVIAAVMGPYTLFVVRDAPPAAGTAHALPVGGRADPIRLAGLPSRDALRQPLFWAISIAFMLFVLATVTWMVHGVPFYESIGISPGGAVALLALAAGLSIGWRLAIGLVADRVPNWELGAMTLTLACLFGVVALLLDQGGVGIGFFMVLFSFGFSAGPLVQPLLLSRAFGLREFGFILGASNTVSTVAVIVGPIVAGAIFDATGSYDWALVMMAGASGGSAMLFLFAARLPRPHIGLPGTEPS